MKRYLPVLALVSAAMAIPAHAGQQIVDNKQVQQTVTEAPIGMGWYIAPFGGANVAQSIGVDRPRVDAFGHTYDVNGSLGRSVGYVLGLKGGYVFDTHTWFLPAAELEAFYDNVDVKANAEADDITAHAKANMQSGNFMLNFIGKINLGRFRPYIGGGAGAAYIYGSDFSGNVDVPGHGDIRISSAGDLSDLAHGRNFRRNTWDFAWQAIGGFDYYFTPRLSLFAEYKALFYYVNQDGLSDYLQHIVVGGVRIHF